MPSRARTFIIAAVLAALTGFGVAAAIGSSDDPQEGDVVKVETFANGAIDTYREQDDGETVIEHRSPDGEVWFESNEVLGEGGAPIICPNGEPLRIDFDVQRTAPSLEAIQEAGRGLPEGKGVAYNPYTGEFEVVDSTTLEVGDTTVSTQEPLVYRCGRDNRPTLVPLSEVDAKAAAVGRRDLETQLEKSGLLQAPPPAPIGDAANNR